MIERINMVRLLPSTVMLLCVISIYYKNNSALEPVYGAMITFSKRPATPSKLLTLSFNNQNPNDKVDDDSIKRIGEDEPITSCTKDNILVFQGPTSPLPDGIPTYTVQIQNACLSESCTISDIHLSCGSFSSARLINPTIFRRIGYDDCLVNDGEPLNPGEALSFQYANTFKYPMSVSSVAC